MFSFSIISCPLVSFGNIIFVMLSGWHDCSDFRLNKEKMKYQRHILLCLFIAYSFLSHYLGFWIKKTISRSVIFYLCFFFYVYLFNGCLHRCISSSVSIQRPDNSNVNSLLVIQWVFFFYLMPFCNDILYQIFVISFIINKFIGNKN